MIEALPGTCEEPLPTLLSREAWATLVFLASRSPPGAFVEIGVYKGGTAWTLAQFGRPLYLYDTFEGHPESCLIEPESHYKGRFSDTSAEAIQEAIPAAHVIKGMFPQSLVRMPLVGFCHADVDTYQSTVSVLENMIPRMAPSGMILFDDYSASDCKGCKKALDDSGLPFLITQQGKALLIV